LIFWGAEGGERREEEWVGEGGVERKRKVSQIVGFLFGREVLTEIVQLRRFAAPVDYHVDNLPYNNYMKLAI